MQDRRPVVFSSAAGEPRRREGKMAWGCCSLSAVHYSLPDVASCPECAPGPWGLTDCSGDRLRPACVVFACKFAASPV